MDYDSNTFNEGVSPGGLRSTTQIKLLIEYLASALDEPLTKDVAVEALTTHMLANYFETVQAIEELLRNGSLQKAGDGTLALTGIGKESLGELFGEEQSPWDELAFDENGLLPFGDGMMKLRRI